MINKKKKALKKRRFFIVFEGISGAGKSENIQRMQIRLNAFKVNSVIIEWNSNLLIKTLLKCLIRFHLLTPRVYSFLQIVNFMIDYLFKYRHNLKKGSVILADRYIYTALTRDVANGLNGHLSRFAAVLAPEPDLVIFIDTHPILCSQRIKNRDKSFFLLNRRLAGNNLIGDKIIYYLECQRKAYLDLFNSPFLGELNVVKCRCEFREISRHVLNFLDLYSGESEEVELLRESVIQ